MLPKRDDDVKALVKLIALLLGSVVFIVLLIVSIFNAQITSLFENKEISNWLYFLPLSILFTGMYQVFNYLLIREKNFARLAKNKVIVSSSNASTQLAIGLTLQNSFGLLLGNLMGYIISMSFIVKSKVINKYFFFKGISVKNVAKEYKKFPQYDVPSVLVNLIANQLPILALGKFFGLGVLGFYSLMYKVLMMPINLLSNTILDVFKQRATEDYNKYGNCEDIFVKTFKKLILLGIIPFSILGVFAPEMFSFVFGEKWKVAGEFAQIMTPMFFLNFLVNPLSYTFYIVQKQNINFFGHFLLLLLAFVSIYVGVILDDVYTLVVLFSVSNSMVYILYLITSYKFSKGNI
jgi:O-antigen/teichoic acid export membrane protein